jgi:hypothetical protein
VPNHKLRNLVTELRAIELWDQLAAGAVLMNELDRTGGFEARRMRRLEIIDEIGTLLTKETEILTGLRQR